MDAIQFDIVLDTIRRIQQDKKARRIHPYYVLYGELLDDLRKSNIPFETTKSALNELFIKGRIKVHQTISSKSIELT